MGLREFGCLGYVGGMILAVAYYRFVDVDDPKGLIEKHHEVLGALDARCRIYISEEGINGQLSIRDSDLEKYIEWMETVPCFKGIEYKVDPCEEHAFEKVSVKYRKEIVALGRKVNWKNQGEHVSPKKWAEMIEKKDDDTILIDVRNDYETAIGHFEGSILPPLKTFRDFPGYVEKLKKEYDPKKTKVMMCCTGGIRCEVFSALMKEEGFDSVFQLQGGIIKYGHEEGGKHWRGNLFVFDDRLVVPLSDDAKPIAHCHSCGKECDTYRNCANMDCNELFIACDACLDSEKGCCSKSCESAKRVRDFREAKQKPFRKLPFEKKVELSQ